MEKVRHPIAALLMVDDSETTTKSRTHKRELSQWRSADAGYGAITSCKSMC